jgi:hypothetical protein
MWKFGKNAISREERSAMKEFIAKHQEEITGVLCGFDRLVFRGTLRSISYAQGMMNYLWAKKVRLTEFGGHVQRVSARLKQACRAKVEALGRPVKYLTSAGESKEEVAREIAARDRIQQGLVCVPSCVEPCRTFEVYRNRETRKPELLSRTRKCLFLYQYWRDREFGFMHARLQTWFPFSVQVCLNGRGGPDRSSRREFVALLRNAPVTDLQMIGERCLALIRTSMVRTPAVELSIQVSSGGTSPSRTIRLNPS